MSPLGCPERYCSLSGALVSYLATLSIAATLIVDTNSTLYFQSLPPRNTCVITIQNVFAKFLENKLTRITFSSKHYLKGWIWCDISQNKGLVSRTCFNNTVSNFINFLSEKVIFDVMLISYCVISKLRKKKEV